MLFNCLRGVEVPNAPCGVERILRLSKRTIYTYVPNAPCGVESMEFIVEEKLELDVPNAPCGVESKNKLKSWKESLE